MIQNNSGITTYQQHILTLEQTTFNSINQMITHSLFIRDLNNIKNEIQRNYQFIQDNYDKKNKVDIAMERLLRFHTYTKGFFTIIKPYSSPISSDLAFETPDAIINIDSKTIDVIGNVSDINYFHFEGNQTSFISNGLGECTYNYNGQTCHYKGVPVRTTLPSIDPISGKPILTFVVRLIYKDDNKTFDFAPRKNLSVTCLPNGELSNLFGNDLVQNFKTYTYLDVRKGFPPIFLTTNTSHTFTNNIYNEISNLGISLPGVYVVINLKTKYGLLDINTKTLWVPVVRTGRNYNSGIYLEAIESGHTARISYSELSPRLDAQGNPWCGHLEYQV